MNESPLSQQDAPPPLFHASGLPKYLFIVLALYVVASEVMGDPFPFPVREIAGGLMIGLLLLDIARRWVSWFRSGGARPSAAWRMLHTAAAALLCYALFTTVYFNPLPGLIGVVLIFMAIPLGLAASVRGVAACRDEVYRASVFESYTWGAFTGLGLITAGIFIVRVTPSASDWLQASALGATNGLSPAAVGFGLGAVFSIVAFSLCLSISWAVWWLRRR